MDGKDMGAASRTSGTGLSGVQSGIIEPVMVRVPEGWFGMGCQTGRMMRSRCIACGWMLLSLRLTR